MQAWLMESLSVLSRAMQSPANSEEWILVAAAGLIGGLSMLKVMALLLGNANESLGSSLVILGLGVAVVLGAAGAASLWGVPAAGSAPWAPWLPGIAAVLALLVIVIPLHMMQQRIGYVTSFLSILAALLMAALLHLLFQTVSEGLLRGQGQFNKMGDRTKSLNQFMK